MNQDNPIQVTGKRLEAVNDFIHLLFSDPIDYTVVELGNIVVTETQTGKVMAIIDTTNKTVEVETGISIFGRATVEYDGFYGTTAVALDRINATYNN